MANDKNNTDSLRDEVDDDPTNEFEIPTMLQSAGDLPAPEIELDEDTYDIDEAAHTAANLSKADLKSTVRAQADKIGELEYELEQITSRYRGLSAELEAREEITNTLNDEALRASDALLRAEEAIQSRDEDHEILQSALDQAREQAADRNRENDVLQKQLAQSKEKTSSLNRQLDEQDARIRKLEDDLQTERHANDARTSSDEESDRRVVALQAQLDTAKAELADLCNYVDKRKAEWDERERAATTASTARDHVGRESRVESEQVNMLKSKLASARSQIDESRAKLKKQTQTAKALRKENRDLKRALDTGADSELRRLRNLSERQAGEIVAARRESERMRHDKRRLEEYADTLRMQVQDQISITRESVAIRTKLEKGLDLAEARLRDMRIELQDARDQGAALQNELATIRNEHEQEIRQIRFELGSAQETLADQETINEQLASDLMNHQTYEQELETQLDESERQRLHTVQKLTGQLESARSEAEELEQKLRMKDAAISDLMKELARAGSDIESKTDEDTGLHGIDGFKSGSNISRSRHAGKDKLARLLIGNADGRELRFPLFKDRLTIGRTSHNDIQLNMQFISRRHAVIATDNGTTRVIDWGSKNGVYVNKVRISEKILESGDVVTIGTTDFRYEERPKR